ncbi:hypothetical protein [Ralstonia pseudosolanacearum]|uniref:hypothetical protein n=1 Tax=Ralstonia pseudosolanacearum TaxID=1310165 RepID=UPI003CFB7FC5
MDPLTLFRHGGVHVLNPAEITSIDETHDLFDVDGVLKVMPLPFWKQFDQQSITYFCVKHGLYCLPTTELIDWLRVHIGERTAIEIGAGNGAICKALGIPGTDSFQQSDPKYAQIYAAQGQQTVQYGPHVLKHDGNDAVRLLRPNVAVGAWVTHRFDPSRGEHGGNEVGVDEHALVASVDEYLVICNEAVHHGKLIVHDIASGKLPGYQMRILPAPVASRSLLGAGADFILSISRSAS